MDPTELKRQGNRLYAEKRYEEARESFLRLIEEAPTVKDGYIGVAKANDVIDGFEETITILEPVVEKLNSRQAFIALAYSLRVLVFRGRLDLADRAIALHQRLLAEKHDAVIAFYLAEMLLDVRNDAEAAFPIYRHESDREPRSRWVHESLIRCCKKLGLLHEILEAERRWEVNNGA